MHATRISVKLFSQKWQKITMMSPEIFQNPGPFLPRVQRIFTLWGNWKDAKVITFCLLNFCLQFSIGCSTFHSPS